RLGASGAAHREGHHRRVPASRAAPGLVGPGSRAGRAARRAHARLARGAARLSGIRGVSDRTRRTALTTRSLRRVLVTGGAGFLGSHLCERLLAEGCEVICFDNLLTGRMENVTPLLGHQRFSFEHYDVTNHLYVAGPLDAVLHFASPASPADFERLPIQILKVGSLGTH